MRGLNCTKFNGQRPPADLFLARIAAKLHLTAAMGKVRNLPRRAAVSYSVGQHQYRYELAGGSHRTSGFVTTDSKLVDHARSRCLIVQILSTAELDSRRLRFGFDRMHALWHGSR